MAAFISGFSEEQCSLTGIIPTAGKKEEVVEMVRENRDSKVFGTFSTFSLYASTAPFSKLERTKIRRLPVNIRAVNSYLLLVCLEVFEGGHVTVAAVEDHAHSYGICYMCCNVLFDLNNKIINEFQNGTAFIVKEPCLRMSSTGAFVIFVESPSDIIKVTRIHDLFKEVVELGWIDCKNDPETATGWKQRGNEHFGLRRYCEAIEAYLVGLASDSDSETKLSLHLNLAAAFLMTRFFESCLEHCKEALRIESNNAKALWRAGRALYELKMYEDAEYNFKKLSNVSPSDSKAVCELQRCKDRLKEQKGEIDIYKLYQWSVEKPWLPIELGEFLDNVETRIHGNVRRVFAKRSLKPGTLVMTEKAFAADLVYAPNVPLNEKTFNGGELLNQVIRAVYQNPKTYERILNLPTNDPENDSCFRRFCNEEYQTEPVVDISRVYHVIKTSLSLFRSEDSDYQNNFTFVTAPHLKYACLGNSSLVAWNDIVIVRALIAIKKGEEIVICGWDKRIEPSTEDTVYAGKICTCAVCELERKDSKSVRKRRVLLTEEFEKLVGCNSRSIFDLGEVIKKLEDNYKGRDKYRTALFRPFLRKAEILARSGETDHDVIVRYLDKALKCLGLSVDILFSTAEDGQASLPKDALLFEKHLVEVVTLIVNFPSPLHKQMRWLRVSEMMDKLFSGGLSRLKFEKMFHI